MKRRGFLKATTTGTVAALCGVAQADAQNSAASASLPSRQSAPLPELGSHWDLLEKLAAQSAHPQMSFLEPQYTNLDEWIEKARAYVFSCIHYAPPKCDPRPEVVETIDRGGHIRERVLINTTPDIRIPVYVLVPKGLAKPAPALVALHDHGGFYYWGKEKLVEVEPEHPALRRHKTACYGGRSIADELARRGYVVVVSDMLHFGERGLYLDADPERIKQRTIDVTDTDLGEFNARAWAHEELLERGLLACGATWSGVNVIDDQRVADYLLTRPEVDPARVGCLGLSLGSVRAIFLGALHEGVRASVAVCWMAEYNQMIRDHLYNSIGYTKLVPGLYTQLGWQDLAALHLPGRLMTINGLKDQLYPLKAAQDAVEKIKRMYAKAGLPDHYHGIFFDAPHEFNLDMQAAAFDWLDKQLD
jgi:dienelactone hydrolase